MQSDNLCSNQVLMLARHARVGNCLKAILTQACICCCCSTLAVQLPMSKDDSNRDLQAISPSLPQSKALGMNPQLFPMLMLTPSYKDFMMWTSSQQLHTTTADCKQHCSKRRQFKVGELCPLCLQILPFSLNEWINPMIIYFKCIAVAVTTSFQVEPFCFSKQCISCSCLVWVVECIIHVDNTIT